MLRNYNLIFDESVPPVEFKISLSHSLLTLQPSMKKEDVKNFGSEFVKFGFALGPHKTFKGQDFTMCMLYLLYIHYPLYIIQIVF
jgi:hypothetical protein